MDFKPLQESIEKPLMSPSDMLITADLRLFGRADQLHIAFQALHKFQEEKKRLPYLNNEDDIQVVVEIAKSINGMHKEVK